MHVSQVRVLRLAIVIASGGCVAVAQAQTAASEPRAEPRCGRYVRNTGRAELCARVIDRRSGVGAPGGNVEFVRDDGASMSGPINRDGTFNLNVPAGRGRLTIAWSCRPSVRLVDTLTLPAGHGTEWTFTVSMTPADTLCRVEPEDRTDTTRAAVARWIGREPCFAIALGQWRADLGTEYAPPQRVRLDSVHAAARNGRRTQPLRYDRPAGSKWRFGGWSPMRGDSLELYWSTGFSVLTLTFGVVGDSLAGRGIWTYDVVVTDSLGFTDTSGLPQGAASARRVSCQ